ASQFNRATDALRQPGSSFKPYVYATALQHGLKPSSIVVDAPICIGNWCPHNYSGGYSGSMTLTAALTRSINTIAVRLSIMIGNGNPKLGRNRIVENARKMGLRTPLPDTPSLPIGADEVTVLDHVGAYTTFPNLGKAATPHAILEVRTGAGETIWRFDRDGPKPRQVFTAQIATDMNQMMSKVVEEGTARRARLDGIAAAGKTGTTNAYRDAWFVGFTGNFVCGIWFGNDDYQSTNRMTGGSLPAMTWHNIMAYAHQGTELKQLPGVPIPTAPRQQLVAEAKSKSNEPAPPPRPTVLTKRGADILVRVERMMDDANRALGPVQPTVSTDKKKQAAGDQKGAALASALEGRAFGGRN
ncbi:MAG: penicillin-binding protein, partial [Rhizobiales bacterium]|nr:penicillin-binding protein [Hyphomicrobiales bacterium]